MNKYTKFLALMGFALLMSACQDDNLIPEAPVLPGDEIVFGATAYLENGDPQTRTVYGDIQGNLIEVRWIDGDRLDIACPETAGPKEIAEYKVVAQGITGNNSTNAESSYASTLVRLEEGAGLQWSSEPIHHFFASYPSKAMIAEKLETTLSQKEIQQLGMTLDGEQNAKLRGYLPVDQTPSNVPTTPNASRDGHSGYVIAPDMTYAYMVAKKTVDTKGNVGLQFTSQMTALEFEIVASDIEKDQENTSPTPHEIKFWELH